MVPLIFCILYPVGVSFVYMSGGSCVQLANNSALSGNSVPIDCVTVYNGTTQSAKWYNAHEGPVTFSSSLADAIRQQYPSVSRSRLYIDSVHKSFQGLYGCEVADIDGENQTLFLGIYTSAVGMSVLLPITL